MQNLEQNLGAPITPTALARWLNLNPQTVRKYAHRWGGMELAPGKIMFFERLVEESIRANILTDPEAPKPAPCEAVSAPRRPKRIQQRWDPFGLVTS